MNNNKVWHKFGVALATALTILAVQVGDGDLTLVEGLTVAIAVLGSVGVYAAPPLHVPSRRA